MGLSWKHYNLVNVATQRSKQAANDFRHTDAADPYLFHTKPQLTVAACTKK